MGFPNTLGSSSEKEPGQPEIFGPESSMIYRTAMVHRTVEVCRAVLHSLL